MRAFIFISEGYMFNKRLKQYLTLAPMTYFTHDEHTYKLVKHLNIKCRKIEEPYNFLLNDAKIVFLFHDYSDTKSEKLLDFVAKRGIPMFILANPLDNLETIL